MRSVAEKEIANLRTQLAAVVGQVLTSYATTEEGFAALRFENGKVIVLPSSGTLELLKSEEAE